LVRNAERELEQIRRIGGAIPENDNYIPNRVRNLLDYKQIVEELLAENPEHCRIAVTEAQSHSRSEVARTLLMASPLLAVSILAPPLSAAGVGAIYGGSQTYANYRAIQSAQQSAYSTPVSDGSTRANQDSVDQARAHFRKELTMIPVYGLVTGLMSGGARSIRRPRAPTERTHH
jgi:hypothetical protein